MPNYQPKGVEWMREIGRLGGLASGARRLDSVDPGKRRIIAMRAARARWGKTKLSEAEEAAYLQARQEGFEDSAGWRRRNRPRPRVERALSIDSKLHEPPDSQAPAVAAVEMASVAVEDRSSTDFIGSLCGRQELKAALALCDSPKARRLLECLCTPKYRSWKAGTIARRCGMTAAEIAGIWRDYKYFTAMIAFIGAIPDVARDVAEDAKSTRVCCPRCDGAGVMLVGRDQKTEVECVQCEGAGTVRKFGNSDARKLIFEAVGITAKREVRLYQHVVQTDDGPSIIERIERAEGSLSIDAESHET